MTICACSQARPARFRDVVPNCISAATNQDSSKLISTGSRVPTNSELQTPRAFLRLFHSNHCFSCIVMLKYGPKEARDVLDPALALGRSVGFANNAGGMKRGHVRRKELCLGVCKKQSFHRSSTYMLHTKSTRQFQHRFAPKELEELVS